MLEKYTYNLKKNHLFLENTLWRQRAQKKYFDVKSYNLK